MRQATLVAWVGSFVVLGCGNEQPAMQTMAAVTAGASGQAAAGSGGQSVGGSGGAGQAGSAGAPATPPADYANMDNWLCRPGRTDACTIDLGTTVIAGDGEHDAGAARGCHRRAHRLLLRLPDRFARSHAEQRSGRRPGRENVIAVAVRALRFAVPAVRAAVPSGDVDHAARCTRRRMAARRAGSRARLQRRALPPGSTTSSMTTRGEAWC